MTPVILFNKIREVSSGIPISLDMKHTGTFAKFTGTQPVPSRSHHLPVHPHYNHPHSTEGEDVRNRSFVNEIQS